MEELQLDPQTLLQLEKDGFLVETRGLRGGQKFFQYHEDIEAFDKTEKSEVDTITNVLTTNQSILKKDCNDGRFERKRSVKASMKPMATPDRLLRSSRKSQQIPEEPRKTDVETKIKKQNRVHQFKKLKPKNI